MVVEKNKLKRKVLMDDNGEARHCRICNEITSTEDVNSNNFEYVKSRLSENYYRSTCVKEEWKKC